MRPMTWLLRIIYVAEMNLYDDHPLVAFESILMHVLELIEDITSKLFCIIVLFS